MKKVDVVIGMNYGDEGKGHVVDYLVSENPAQSAVVRFNGGAQAAHTVEVGDKRHVFHHFGSGSFSGASTILSRFFVVNPVLFFEERTSDSLKDEVFDVYVDPSCYVTTPYDVMLNREREKARNDGKHGSCGIGFGETIQREEDGFRLHVSDLKDPDMLLPLLFRIRTEYFMPEMLKLYTNDDMPLIEDMLNEAEKRFIQDANDFLKAVSIIKDVEVFRHFDHVVFEGAQGLRLDQYSVDFPHVTRSSTGLENVVTLINDTQLSYNINVHYLTRSYLTRHGAGPLEQEIITPGAIDKTNVPNEHQGSLRFAKHNFIRMTQDVTRDKKFLTNCTANHIMEYTAVVTCCDQYDLFMNDYLNSTIELVERSINATRPTIKSWGPKRHDFNI